jgi:hypothetical protein
MGIELAIDPDYDGPTIMGLAASLEKMEQGNVHIRWDNTRREIRLIRAFPNRTFVLHVKGDVDAKRAMMLLGLPLKLDSTMLERAKLVLGHQKSYDWHKYAESVGPVIAKSLVIKMAANLVRSGNPNPFLIEAVKNVVLKDVAPIDTDLLLRLGWLEAKQRGKR